MGSERVKKIWEVYDSVEDIKKDSEESIHTKTGIPIDIVKEIKRIIEK